MTSEEVQELKQLVIGCLDNNPGNRPGIIVVSTAVLGIKEKCVKRFFYVDNLAAENRGTSKNSCRFSDYYCIWETCIVLCVGTQPLACWLHN